MNTKKIFFFLLLLIGSNGMSVAQKVEIDFDKDVDFSKYKSATFLGWQDGIEKVISEFDQKRFRDAFKDELDKRNLVRVETGGDLVFALYLVIEQKPAQRHIPTTMAMVVAEDTEEDVVDGEVAIPQPVIVNLIITLAHSL